MTTPLYQLVAQYRSLEAMDASEDLPLTVIQDTLEGLTGELTEKATNVARYVLNVEAMAEAVERASTQMKARANRMRNRADSIREYLRHNMVAAGITKIEAVEFVLSLKKNPPSVVIDDETLIPADYMVTPEQPPTRPSKSLIAKAIKDGFVVPGAHSESGQRLEIKQ